MIEDQPRPAVYPSFASKKWGWTLKLVGAQSVIFDGDEMLSFSSEEAAVEWAQKNGYRVERGDDDV